MKEEYVSGSYGVEGRYPSWTRWLFRATLELKNSNYKSVLHYYLEKNNYPFNESQKVGFNCGFSPQRRLQQKEISHRTVGEAADKTLIVDFELEESRTESRRDRHVLC